MRIIVVKEELQEMVDYSCDPILGMDSASLFVFSHLLLGICWTIFPAFLGGVGGEFRLAWGIKGPNPIVEGFCKLWPGAC